MKTKDINTKVKEEEIIYYSADENSVILKVCLTIFSVVLGVCVFYIQSPVQV